MCPGSTPERPRRESERALQPPQTKGSLRISGPSVVGPSVVGPIHRSLVNVKERRLYKGCVTKARQFGDEARTLTLEGHCLGGYVLK